MQLLKIVTLTLWGLQFLFGIVVVGLSADKVKKQVFDGAPVTDQYSIFSGAFGMIVCAVGIASSFVDLIPTIVVLVGNGLSGLAYLAGGIAYSISLRGFNCGAGVNTDTFQKLIDSSLLNLGSMTVDDDTIYGFTLLGGIDGWEGLLRDNCRRAFADQTIQYLAFALAVATAGLTYWMKGRKSSTSYV